VGVLFVCLGSKPVQLTPALCCLLLLLNVSAHSPHLPPHDFIDARSWQVAALHCFEGVGVSQRMCTPGPSASLLRRFHSCWPSELQFEPLFCPPPPHPAPPSAFIPCCCEPTQVRTGPRTFIAALFSFRLALRASVSAFICKNSS
jgi:hypothetical protein